MMSRYKYIILSFTFLICALNLTVKAQEKKTAEILMTKQELEDFLSRVAKLRVESNISLPSYNTYNPNQVLLNDNSTKRFNDSLINEINNLSKLVNSLTKRLDQSNLALNENNFYAKDSLEYKLKRLSENKQEIIVLQNRIDSLEKAPILTTSIAANNIDTTNRKVEPSKESKQEIVRLKNRIDSLEKIALNATSNPKSTTDTIYKKVEPSKESKQEIVRLKNRIDSLEKSTLNAAANPKSITDTIYKKVEPSKESKQEIARLKNRIDSLEKNNKAISLQRVESFVATPVSNNEVDILQKRIDQLNAELLAVNNKQTNTTRSFAAQEVNNRNAEVEQLQSQVKSLNNQLRSLENSNYIATQTQPYNYPQYNNYTASQQNNDLKYNALQDQIARLSSQLVLQGVQSQQVQPYTQGYNTSQNNDYQIQLLRQEIDNLNKSLNKSETSPLITFDSLLTQEEKIAKLKLAKKQDSTDMASKIAALNNKVQQLIDNKSNQQQVTNTIQPPVVYVKPESAVNTDPYNELYKNYNQKIYFANNSTNISNTDKNALQQLATIIKQANDKPKIVINGFASKVGNAQINNEISFKRAESAKNILTGYGIPASDILIFQNGMDKTSSEELARRVEITIMQ